MPFRKTIDRPCSSDSPDVLTAYSFLPPANMVQILRERTTVFTLVKSDFTRRSDSLTLC